MGLGDLSRRRAGRRQTAVLIDYLLDEFADRLLYGCVYYRRERIGVEHNF